MFRSLRIPSAVLAGFLRLSVVALLAWSATAHAQGVTGSAVTGTVSEEGTEMPLEGTILQLKNPSTGDTFNTVTDASGHYFFDNVPSGGPYTLSATASGYKVSTQTGIQLGLGARQQLDLVMRFQIEEIVIVEEVDPLADTGRTGASTTVQAKEISRIPLQGRNFTDLVGTSPQVNGNSFAGQNNRYNNIQVDGGANNDLFGLAGNGTPGGQAGAKPISLEAIKEFVIQIAPFDVRQGSFTGGLVNAITKSGTNEFHGGAFVYFQNKGLAGDRSHTDVPAADRNASQRHTFDDDLLDYNTWQFGANVGGPIIKDKLHFFVSGDFQVKAQSFGNAFQIGGEDSMTDIAKAGFDVATVERFQNILSSKYGINDPGDALAPELKNPDRNVFVKLTTSMIQNSRLELSYNFVNANQDNLTRAPTSPSIPGRLRDGYQLSNSGYGQANSTHTVRLKFTSNFGKFSNELLAGFSIIGDERELPNRLPLILVKVGKLGAADSWLAAGGERFSHENILDQDVYQIQDNLTWALGQHRITFGTSNEFFNIRNVFFQAAFGVWAFDSLDAFEAGTASAFQRRFGISPKQDPGTAEFTVAQIGFYVQDEWSLLKNLTLTPGVRIDVPFLSDGVTNDMLVNNTAFPIDTAEVPSGNPLFSPRLGVNWDVLGNLETIVRGGVGVFTGRPPYVWVGNAYSINGLSQVELTCTGMVIPAFTPNPDAQPSDCMGGTNAPTQPTNQGEIDYFDPDTKYPQNLRFALGADQKLPWGVVATGDFLYTQDINGWYVTDANLSNVGESGEGRDLYGTFGATGFAATATRVDPMHLRQAVKVFNKNGGRVFNFTLQAQKTFKKIFSVSAAYTYANSKDRISLTSSQALSNFQFSPIDGNLEERNVRPSAFDRPHKVTITGTASLPYGFGVGLTYVGQSGLPYTWTVNGDVNADGINGNDVVFVPESASQITLMDPTQYDALAAFIDGQACLKSSKGKLIQRGACRNPWQNFLNLRASWQSPPVAGQRIEVQFDIFNVMNLLNADWGLLDQYAGFENHSAAFLRAVGYDTTNNRPIYSFTAPSETALKSTVFTPTTSRWRIQLGARYTF